ncbi:uncharacterized protein PAC_17207 [Phialocephala subalpina]|uniref:Uncharacterized protein n=1 Tax=Phialocephala subalpina TaxID=576137 RepID=A0A1L7XQT0_9HELO|nr:uncharacterized protein PAC_17207 [Phialocephala subalpina]
MNSANNLKRTAHDLQNLMDITTVEFKGYRLFERISARELDEEVVEAQGCHKDSEEQDHSVIILGNECGLVEAVTLTAPPEAPFTSEIVASLTGIDIEALPAKAKPTLADNLPKKTAASKFLLNTSRDSKEFDQFLRGCVIISRAAAIPLVEEVSHLENYGGKHDAVFALRIDTTRK